MLALESVLYNRFQKSDLPKALRISLDSIFYFFHYLIVYLKLANNHYFSQLCRTEVYVLKIDTSQVTQSLGMK